MRRALTFTFALVVALGGAIAPVQSPVSPGAAQAAVVVDDDFAGDERNPDYWDGEVYGSGTSYSQDSGALTIALASGAAQTSKSYFGAGFRGRCALTGNFDMQVDYTLPTWPSSNGVRVGLTLEDGADWLTSGRLYATRTSLGSALVDVPTAPQRNNYLTDNNGTLAWAATSDTSGKLRLTRTGTSWAAYYWNSGWTSIASGTTSTTTAFYGIKAWSTDAVFADQAVEVTFDEFLLDGTRDCPTESIAQVRTPGDPEYQPDTPGDERYNRLTYNFFPTSDVVLTMDEALPDDFDLGLRCQYGDYDETVPEDFVGTTLFESSANYENCFLYAHADDDSGVFDADLTDGSGSFRYEGSSFAKDCVAEDESHNYAVHEIELAEEDPVPENDIIAVSGDVYARPLETCMRADGTFGTSMVFPANLQDSEGHIVQIGYQMCGGVPGTDPELGCGNGIHPEGDLRVVWTPDDNTPGILYLFDYPPLTLGDLYRFKVYRGGLLDNVWYFCVRNISMDEEYTCDSSWKTWSDPGGRYAWWGAENYRRQGALGVRGDYSYSQLEMHWLQYMVEGGGWLYRQNIVPALKSLNTTDPFPSYYGASVDSTVGTDDTLNAWTDLH